MDKRLILNILLVMLSWECMAANATNTTEAPINGTNSANMTTGNSPISNNTLNTTATASSSTNATNVAPTINSTNGSSATNAPTVSPTNNSTNGSSATNAPTVSPTNNSTNGSSATTPAPANNVTTVNIPAIGGGISRQECGSSKLCAAEPSKCDPSTGDNCYFISAKQQSGQTYNFELSGKTDGYIAAGLSTTATQSGSHTAYICANNNGGVRFFTGSINNLVLTLTNTTDSSNQRGSVNSGKIQCTFTAVLPDTTTRAAGYALSVSTGDYDANTQKLGTPSFRLLTPRVNLSDPTTNLTNLLSNTTSSAYPVTHIQSFMPVLLVTVCMLAFATVN